MKNGNKIVLVILMIAMVIWVLPFLAKNTSSQGQEINDTYLVNTTVNITNAAPLVKDVSIPDSISLTADANTTVQCNVTTYDYNNDTIQVNASLFYNLESPVGPVDQNYRYINSSCTNVSGIQDYEINWTCSFQVNYFANNGSWFCNATAIDENDAVLTNQSSAGVVQPLIAIKMDDVLDFGDYAAGEISDSVTANVTNSGNRNLNITVEGYGQTPGDGYAMVCEYGSSIPIGNERYQTSDLPYTFMVPLTGTAAKIPDPWYVPQRTDESNEVTNTTYWRVQVPIDAVGLCNGKIKFSAIDRGD